MSAKPILLVVAAALIDAEGRVLITQRPPGKALAGLWEFPGGKIDPGEIPEAALVRELEEELGIQTTQDDLAPFSFASYEYEMFHILMPLFVCRAWQGIPQGREGQGLAWVHPTRMGGYDMPPADRPLVVQLQERL